MSHTRYEWTLIDYALWTAGAVVVPIYETSSAEQAEWILANSEARAVIAETDGFAAMIADARDRLPALRAPVAARLRPAGADRRAAPR